MNAKRDNNGIAVIQGALNTDGVTPTSVVASPTLHTMAISDGTTGSDNGTVNAKRDANQVTDLMALSTDGVTPVALYVDSSGNLLTKST